MEINVNYHSSIKIGDIYVDPFKIDKNYNDAKYIFITHSHYDHYSLEDIDKIVNTSTVFICTKDVGNDLKERYSNRIMVVEPNKYYFINDIKFDTIHSSYQ
jgi:L-ascorbate metabolism protein UlaG (beta-lactamase superfamily)